MPHSIINRPPKPAWLKGLAVIDVGPYHRFYRQLRRGFAGAGGGAICGATTPATPSSINSQDTENSAFARSPLTDWFTLNWLQQLLDRGGHRPRGFDDAIHDEI
ncbi:MAG: hypothetical protein ACREYA_25455 [Cupriavidus necator]